MESAEHNWSNISETICLLDVALFRISSQIPNFHKLTPYSCHFHSYYSSAFTINQFHSYEAEVYAP